MYIYERGLNSKNGTKL